MPTGKYTFNSYIKNSFVYNLIIFGFNIATGIFGSIRLKLKILAIMSFAQVLVLTLKMKRAKFTISSTLLKFIIKPLQIIIIKRPVFVVTMRQTIKFVQSLLIKRPTFIVVLHLISKLGNIVIKIPKTVLLAIPVIAQYSQLLTFDPQTLSALDTNTLGGMDYTIAP
jgi:hypothetical protein